MPFATTWNTCAVGLEVGVIVGVIVGDEVAPLIPALAVPIVHKVDWEPVTELSS